MKYTVEMKADLADLLERPQFKRFLFRVIQKAGIFNSTTNGSDGRNLVLEGRRTLGLEILAEVDGAQPIPSPLGIPTMTLIQVLREEAQHPQEKPNVARPDTYADLRD